MKSTFFLLCENFLKDGSGKGSIINIFDGVGAESFPAVPARFGFATNIVVSNEEIKKAPLSIKITITDNSSSEEVLEVTGVSASNLKAGNIVSYIDLSGKIVIQAPGEYTAHLFVGNKELATTVFNVSLTKEGTKK